MSVRETDPRAPGFPIVPRVSIFLFFLVLLAGCERSANTTEKIHPKKSIAVVDTTTSEAEPVKLVQRATPEMLEDLATLLASLDKTRPGAAVAKLSAFRSEFPGYDTQAQVEAEISRYHSLSKGRYSVARELARNGKFAAAESVLVDLAENIPGSSDGEKAREHLAFGFHMNRAQQLLLIQRYSEAGEIARELLKNDLSKEQSAQAEQLLDSVSQVNSAYAMIERQTVEQATRRLMMILTMRFVEDGYYPSSFSWKDLKEWDPQGAQSVMRSLERVDGYRVHGNLVSLTAVGKQTGYCLRVIDGEIIR